MRKRIGLALIERARPHPTPRAVNSTSTLHQLSTTKTYPCPARRRRLVIILLLHKVGCPGAAARWGGLPRSNPGLLLAGAHTKPAAGRPERGRGRGWRRAVRPERLGRRRRRPVGRRLGGRPKGAAPAQAAAAQRAKATGLGLCWRAKLKRGGSDGVQA